MIFIFIVICIKTTLAIIPKSTSYAHLKENVSLDDFCLDQNDFDQINGLSKNLHLCWNPDTVL